MQQLLQVPNVGPVLRAVTEEDVDALLALIDWQPIGCGSPHGATELCPSGTATGTELPMVNVGASVPFWVTEERLRPALENILAGEPLAVVFASRTSETPYSYRREGLGDVYYLGLEGAARPVSGSPLWGDLGTMTGVFLIVDSGSERPILGLAPLGEGWSATQHAYAWGFEGHEVITFNP